MTQNTRTLIAKLSKNLEDHNYRYYILAQPVIEDREYDRLMQLKEQEQNNDTKEVVTDSVDSKEE